MKTILLVDDEPKIRNHIRFSLPWHEWGFRIVGEAANGEEALALCGQLRPDIALIDVTMPVMDGLTLLGHLAGEYPGIRSIMLTMHRDFHYAQQAMQRGALGYLLKTPFDMGEMRSVLERAGKDVDKERVAQQNQLARQQLLKNYHYPMRQKFFEQLLTGLHATDEEIVRQAEVIGIHLPYPSYHLLMCQMDDLMIGETKYPDKDRPLVEFSTLELVREALDESAVGRYELFPIVYGQFVILYDGVRANDIMQLARTMAGPLRNYMNIRLTVLASDPYGQIRQTRAVYAQLRAKLPALFYMYRPCPAFVNQLPPLGTLPQEEWDLLAARWRDTMRTLEQATLRSWLQAAEKAMLQHRPHPGELLERLALLDTQAESAFRQEEGWTGIRIPEWPALHRHMNMTEVLQEIERWAQSCMRLKAASVAVRHEIAVCLKFIREHLEDDLSVETVAQQAKISASHLSHLFKKEVGCTVGDYILEKRIEQAKIYLTSGQYLNYELIEKVGFRSYSYFCTLFKKYTGMTPNEYKRMHKPSVMK